MKWADRKKDQITLQIYMKKCKNLHWLLTVMVRKYHQTYVKELRYFRQIPKWYQPIEEKFLILKNLI